jgi:hypothetical protein
MGDNCRTHIYGATDKDGTGEYSLGVETLDGTTPLIRVSITEYVKWIKLYGVMFNTTVDAYLDCIDTGW